MKLPNPLFKRFTAFNRLFHAGFVISLSLLFTPGFSSHFHAILANQNFLSNFHPHLSPGQAEMLTANLYGSERTWAGESGLRRDILREMGVWGRFRNLDRADIRKF